MSLQEVIKKEIDLLKPDESSLKEIRKLTDKFLEALNKEIAKSGVDADVFIGGSFAKGTFMKADKYDIDVFVRFDWKYENLSTILEKILRKTSNNLEMSLEVIHGSRDYFRVYNGDANGYFEVIPVTRIKKPQEERNVTDLTYFHAPYVKKRISGLENQVRLAKQFFRAQEVYGAETYVSGFSGYTVELLIIYYKGFLKMLREMIKLKDGSREVIDIAKHYKNKREVFVQLNEAKLHSPIILIDPTYKERNALAALSNETFQRLQKSARAFLKRPSLKFFIKKPLDYKLLEERAKEKDFEFAHIGVHTAKQPGDIAGTKLKKFSEMLIRELQTYFQIKETHFDYNGGSSADFYLVVKPKKEIVRIGPPLTMKKHVSHFKSEHMNTFTKGKFIHARIPIKFDIISFLDAWKKSNEKKISEMYVDSMVLH